MSTSDHGTPPTEDVRVALFGFGQVGRRMATILSRRDGVEVVAVISRSLGGQPARQHVPGLPADLIIDAEPERALAAARPHVVLHATAPTLAEVVDQLLLAVRSRAHVISSCEELAYPWVVHREAAERLDHEARGAGVSVLGTGVNPGFVFDALVLEALGSRWTPTSIIVSRVSDASGFGPAVRRRLGLGLPPAEFEAMVAAGTMACHVGFRESMDLVAAALGTQVQDFAESMRPVVAVRDDADVMAGTTAGFTQLATGTGVAGAGIGTGTGTTGGGIGVSVRFEFRLALHLWPARAGLAVIDSVAIEDGGKIFEIQVRPASVGLDSAAAQLVNAIPHIMTAEPGLRTRLDMRGPSPWVAYPRSVGWKR
jgi:4-hydroxy-tetrahydrodipicolinate reductase